jgi:hypothetical protein
MVNEFPEYAEEYSSRERVRLAAVGLVTGGVFVLLCELWLLPAFSAFAASAPCRSVFGIPATAILWYGLFVGLPLSLALVLACMEGRHGLKILRDGQSPPTGFKVLRRTRIKRGVAARRIGYLRLFAFAPFMAIATWGAFQARSLSKPSQLKHPACTANYSVKRTAATGCGSIWPRSVAAACLQRLPAHEEPPRHDGGT